MTQLETKFYRKLLHVKKNTPILGIRGELGRHPIAIKAINRSIKFYNKCLDRTDDKLVKQAMIEATNQHHKGTKSWFTKFEDLNKNLSPRPAQSNMTNYQKRKLNKSYERSIQNKYEDYWLEQINSTQSKSKNRGGNKLRTYNKVKQHFALEKYLTTVYNPIHRASLTQLRLSSHRLNIESLRGKVLKAEERVCKICNLNSIEDEIHLLTICPKYETLREDLYNSMNNYPQTCTLNKEDRAIWLLSNEDDVICNKMAKLIYNCFQLRYECLKTM